jgi:hypothetical protein
VRPTLPLGLIVLLLGIGTASAAVPGPQIPPLPATLDGAEAMVQGLGDPVLKATLAQPGLRGRVDALLGFGGCDWTVNANLARQQTPKQAALYLDGLEDDALMAALTRNGMLDRLNTIFDRNNCMDFPPQNRVLDFPNVPARSNQGVGPMPYGYTGMSPYGYGGSYGYPGLSPYTYSGAYGGLGLYGGVGPFSGPGGPYGGPYGGGAFGAPIGPLPQSPLSPNGAFIPAP